MKQWHATIPSISIWSCFLVERKVLRISSFVITVYHELSCFWQSCRSRCVQEACRIGTNDILSVLITWHLSTALIYLACQLFIDLESRYTHLFHCCPHAFEPLHTPLFLVNKHNLYTRDFKAMHQTLSLEVVVQMSRCTPDTKETEPDDHEVCAVHHISSDHISRFHAL